MLAGPDKSLKSYLGTFIDLAVLSGVTLFDMFPVQRTGPVVVYVGEGGKKPYLRRVKRIAEGMGIDPKVLGDYHIITQTAPVNSQRFQKSLERDLAEVQPILVRMDPYYAYHGGEADARNLHQEGANLNLVSEPCTEAGANLLISNHFNQTGKGLHLKRITMAGAAEWVDSWILVEKTSEDEQNVAFGQFKLKLAVGSRQWGGTDWTLSLDIGYYDQLAGDHVGTVSWSIEAATSRAIDGGEPKRLKMRKRAIEVLTEHPWEKSKTEVAKALGVGNQGERLDYLDSELKRTGDSQLIMERKVPTVNAAGATRTLPRLGLSPTHTDSPVDYPLVPGTGLAT